MQCRPRNALKLLICPQITVVYKELFSAVGAGIDFNIELQENVKGKQFLY